ncbi:MAG TPA: hypothetical protein VL093_12025 [Flavipsychrobacter sp.]|nr:hypothetical protein [Flavipsychrobacter sp.]
MLMWQKFLHYLKRYGFAEIAGAICVLLISSLTYYFTRNKIIAAYAGTIGENIGFYGVIIIRDMIDARRKTAYWSTKEIWPVLRSILIEFGIAEALDTLVMRPLMLYLFTSLFTNYQLGALVGVVIADILFYSLAVLSSELSKKHRNSCDN